MDLDAQTIRLDSQPYALQARMHTRQMHRSFPVAHQFRSHYICQSSMDSFHGCVLSTKSSIMMLGSLTAVYHAAPPARSSVHYMAGHSLFSVLGICSGSCLASLQTDSHMRLVEGPNFMRSSSVIHFSFSYLDPRLIIGARALKSIHSLRYYLKW